MKKLRHWLMLCVLWMGIICCGCAQGEEKVEKLRDLDYTVLGNEEQPETLKQLLEERKSKPFHLSYSEGEFLYICVGYGEQPTGGFSIQVEDFYEGEEVMYVNTTLVGPTTEEQPEEKKSYPILVLKTEYLDKTVVFE